jgi:hypothetical protein
MDELYHKMLDPGLKLSPSPHLEQDFYLYGRQTGHDVIMPLTVEYYQKYEPPRGQKTENNPELPWPSQTTDI